MRHIMFRIWVLVAILSFAHSMHTKSIAKRQICSDNTCNNGCDGRSCNTCNNNVCCSNVSCNRCANQCSNNCNTPSCSNNCVSACSTTCQGNNNCAVSSCSQCVNRCSNQCSSNQCANDCSRSCDCTSTTTSTKDVHNDSVLLVPSSEASSVIVNNTNNNLVNLTTHINIDNVIHNFNNISIPVYVNTTNINNINLSENHQSTETQSGGSSPPSVYPVPYPVIQPQQQQPLIISQPAPIITQPVPSPIISQSGGDNCCYVLHPRTCYNDDQGNRRCYIRRSRECSGACTSPVISIEQEATSNSGCQRVNTWPYYYCGNYVRRDCNQCYTCGGNYNPSQCFRQSECSDGCRSAAPNCVPSQSGLQCY